MAPINLKSLALIEGKVMYSRWYWTLTYVERVEWCLAQADAEAHDMATKRLVRGV